MQTGIGYGGVWLSYQEAKVFRRQVPILPCFDLWDNRRGFFWEKDHHTPIGLQFHNVVRWLKVMHLDHYHLCFYSTIVHGMQT